MSFLSTPERLSTYKTHLQLDLPGLKVSVRVRVHASVFLFFSMLKAPVTDYIVLIEAGP